MIFSRINQAAQTQPQSLQRPWSQAALEHTFLHAHACGFQNFRNPVEAIWVRDIVGNNYQIDIAHFLIDQQAVEKLSALPLRC